MAKKACTIAIVNEKGGCGKSTTAVNLGAGLAQAGFRTCLVDLDQQCNSTANFAIDPDELPKEGKFSALDIYLQKKRAVDIQLPLEGRFGGNLTLIPGSRGLGSVHHRLEATMQAELAAKANSIIMADELREEHRIRLQRSLGSLDGECDFVLLDTPGDLGFLVTTALIAADYYMIPIFPSAYDLQGLDALTASIHKVRDRLNPKLKFLGVLFGRVDGRTRLDADIKKNLREHLGTEYIFETGISNSVKVREAPIHAETIFEYDPRDPTARQFKELTVEVAKKTGREMPVSETSVERVVEITPAAAPEAKVPTEAEAPTEAQGLNEEPAAREAGNG